MKRPQAATLCLAMVAVLSHARFVFGEESFDQVKGGVLTVYPIDDLTRGNDDAAKQIDSLIRNSVSPEVWANAGGTAAASRVTSQRLTVKASAELQTLIAFILSKVREGKSIYFRCEYQVVDTTTLPSTPSAEEVKDVAIEGTTPLIGRVPAAERYFKVVDPKKLPQDTATVMATSEVTTSNGDDSLWIDGNGLSLPSVKANPVMWRDRRGIMVTLDFEDAKSKHTKRISKSVVFGETAAVPIDSDGKRWLLFRASQVEKIWKPVGAASTPPQNAG